MINPQAIKLAIKTSINSSNKFLQSINRDSNSLLPLHLVLIPVQKAIARQVRFREPTSLYPVSHVNRQTVLKVKSSVVQIMLPFLGIMRAGQVFTET